MVSFLKEMIIFENAHVIVINKKSGIPCQMGTGFEGVTDTTQTKKEPVQDHMVIDQILQQYASEGRLVHRLDRKTSGVMVLTKTKEMAAWLTKMIMNKDTVKEYVALLCGEPIFEAGIIKSKLSEKESLWQIESLD